MIIFVSECNQLDDPRQQFKEQQQQMLQDYLVHAQSNLEVRTMCGVSYPFWSGNYVGLRI